MRQPWQAYDPDELKTVTSIVFNSSVSTVAFFDGDNNKIYHHATTNDPDANINDAKDDKAVFVGGHESQLLILYLISAITGKRFSCDHANREGITLWQMQ